MPSLFNRTFAAVAAKHLVHQFGERDENGEFRKLLYRDARLPAASEPFELTGISSGIRSIEELMPGELGISRVDSKTWQIPREQLDAVGITHPQRNAMLDDYDSAEPFDWSLRVQDCVWGQTFVTLSLERAPLVVGNEVRGAAG